VTPERLHRLQSSLAVALQQEWPALRKAAKDLKQLTPIAIQTSSEKFAAGSRPLPVIATVATDGGENRLSLAPLALQLIRVADSEGRLYCEEFFAQSLAPSEILSLFKTDKVLAGLVKQLRLKWDDLLPQTDYQRANLLSLLREMMEWAALLQLATEPGPRLLLRDGLLRSVLLPETVFHKLVEHFEALTFRNKHLLAGVAKKSAVIDYLSLALDLEGMFHDPAPGFVAIPAALEREAAPANYRWVGTRAMGWLHVARLDRGRSVPLLPVDVPSWQRDRAEEIMIRLTLEARGSFPQRGYPRALSAAHEHAHIGGLEIELLEGLLLKELQRVSPKVARAALEMRLAGKTFVQE